MPRAVQEEGDERSVLRCVCPLECERHKVPPLQTRQGSANPTVMPTIRFNCRPCLSESIGPCVGTDLYFFARGCRHQLNTTQNDFNCAYFRGPINESVAPCPPAAVSSVTPAVRDDDIAVTRGIILGENALVFA